MEYKKQYPTWTIRVEKKTRSRLEKIKKELDIDWECLMSMCATKLEEDNKTVDK